jgi:hypothetical protein
MDFGVTGPEMVAVTVVIPGLGVLVAAEKVTVVPEAFGTPSAWNV